MSCQLAMQVIFFFARDLQPMMGGGEGQNYNNFL